MTTIWVIRWALGSGKILKREAYLNNGMARYQEGHSSGDIILAPEHYSLTEKDARAALDQLRTAKIKSLEKQIKKLEHLRVRIDDGSQACDSRKSA